MSQPYLSHTARMVDHFASELTLTYPVEYPHNFK